MKRIFSIFALMLAVMLPGAQAYAAKTEVDIPGWSMSFIGYPDSVQIDWSKTGIKLTRDPELTADGLASLHLFIENQMDNLNLQASQNVAAMEPGKSYRLTGKFKVPANGWRFRIMFGNTQVVTLGELVSGLNEWSEVEYVFAYNYPSTEFRIQSCGTGSLYADNVALQEVLYDENGEVSGYGKNLLANGDFEADLDLTPPKEVSGLAVENGDTKAVITWKNPDDTDFAGVEIYDITDGIEPERLDITSAEEYTAAGLENDKFYTYLLQTVDNDGNRSQGVTVELAPIADAFKYTEPVFYLNDKETQSLGVGRLRAKMNFTNNRMSEDYSAELILVLEKDGALYDIQSGFATIPTSQSNTEVEVEIDVPEDALTAYLYVWDSISGMAALKDYYIFE